MLSLIESEKLDICDISLSKITDSYLKRIEEIEGDSSEIADFLVVAAKLLYLKSRELLPDIRNEEEDEEIADLERNLLEYQKYKNAADELSVVLSKNYRSFPRKAVAVHEPGFFPPEVGPDRLYQIFQDILTRVEKSESKEELVAPIKITIDEKKDYVRKNLTRGKVSFRSLFKEAHSKSEVIVTFLAVLELIKLKQIYAKQQRNFGDLTLYRVK